MADDKKKGVKGIEKTRKSTVVQQVESVEDVQKVEKAKGVGKVKKSSGAGGADEARKLRYEDREKLLNMVDEESKKLFGTSSLPAKQKKIIQEAVKMAIDAALVPDDEKNEGKEKE